MNLPPHLSIYAMPDRPVTVEDRHVLRIAVALRVAELLRVALERSGNCYSGSLVPNLTSLTDVLHLPFATLWQQLELTPVVRPHPDLTALKSSIS
jgi:hypothetical protein